jgi:outer membrane protein assembly factor BamB
VVAGDLLLVGTDVEGLWVINRLDGSIVFQWKSEYPVNSSVAVVNGSVYFGSTDNYVYALY